jgi:hypothetical protein
MSYTEKRQPGRATSHEHGIVRVRLGMGACNAHHPPCEDFRADYQISIDKTFRLSVCTSVVCVILHERGKH